MERDFLRSSSTLRGNTGGNGNLFSPPVGSALGKRGAAAAGLDPNAEDVHREREHRDLKNKYAQLERQNTRFQRVEAEQQQEIEDLKTTVARLERERQVLAEAEAKERATSEERDQAWASERMQLNSNLVEWRTRANRSREDVEQLMSENQKLKDSMGSQQSALKDVAMLRSRLKEVEIDSNELREYKRRSAGLSIELEECKRRIQAGSGGLGDSQNGGGSRGGEVQEGDGKQLRQELTRQAQMLRSAQSELAKLREDRGKTDETARALSETIKNLKSDNRQLHQQLERARREMESLTLSFPSTSDSSEDYSTVKSRLTALTALHDGTIAELDRKDVEIASLQTRLTDVTRSAQLSMADLARTKADAERELRWAKEGRVSAEKREQMARNELEALRISDIMPGSISTGDQSARVRQLETLVQSLKVELEGMSRDSRDAEERIAKGMGLVKQSELDSAVSRIAQMQSDIDSFSKTIEELTSANNALDAEVSDLMRRVASGEYDPSTERCIEFKNNPAAKATAMRTEALERLKSENDALLERLAVVDKTPVTVVGQGASGSSKDGLVPRESFERVVRDKEEMERAHAKRLLRLKEIFGNKSKEFLEAVYSLLGWRIKFDESGADIRLTSMYAPKGKMGLTLKFASQEGHFGTMQMTGAMSRGLEECRHFWIVERQSVPGFLAQVTTEMFEKTTVTSVWNNQSGRKLWRGIAGTRHHQYRKVGGEDED